MTIEKEQCTSCEAYERFNSQIVKIFGDLEMELNPKGNGECNYHDTARSLFVDILPILRFRRKKCISLHMKSEKEKSICSLCDKFRNLYTAFILDLMNLDNERKDRYNSCCDWHKDINELIRHVMIFNHIEK